ncbi:MAG: flagellar export chaperone FlgN [Flavobacteriaceae bacterium]
MALSDQLLSALESTKALHQLLEKEFNFLSNQNYDSFQSTQLEKIRLLETIKKFDEYTSSLIKKESTTTKSSDSVEQLLSIEEKKLWDEFLNELKACDLLHRKTDQYLTQKIKTTNMVLDILQVNKSHNATQLYDAFGKNKLSTLSKKITEA